MELCGKGLRKGSAIWFYTSSQMAKRLFFYPLVAGDFYCTANYRVKREQYDSILLLLVLEGEMVLQQDGAELTAKGGELLLVDCYRQHEYAAVQDTHTLWVHFDGVNSRELFQELKQQRGQKQKASQELLETVQNIVQGVSGAAPESELSIQLYMLICRLLAGSSIPEQTNTRGSQIAKGKEYMKQHLKEPLAIEEIAEHVSMSASYFTKVFKEMTGFSPYEYLLRLRLERAKELLLQTELSIGEVAYCSGFHSDSNFIYFFKKETGISPLKFRGMKF